MESGEIRVKKRFRSKSPEKSNIIDNRRRDLDLTKVKFNFQKISLALILNSVYI